MDKKKKKSLNLGEIIKKLDDRDSGYGGAGDGVKDPVHSEPVGPPERKDLPVQDLPEQPSFGASQDIREPKNGKMPKAEDAKNAGAVSIPNNLKQAEDSDPQDRAVSGKNQTPILSQQQVERSEEEEFDVFKYISVLLRRKEVVLFVAIIVTIFSIFSYLRGQKFYTVKARLLFKPNPEGVIGTQTGWYYYQEREKILNTHLELLKSAIVLERVAENMGGRIETADIAGGLEIRQGETDGEKNNILELSYRNVKAETARDVVNELCRTYIEYHREVSAQEDTRLILKLEAQIDKLQRSLGDKENDLRQFKENNQMVQLSSETNIIISKLSDMEIALQQTQINLLESKERLNSLRTQIGQQEINIVQSMTYDNPFQQKISSLELELNTLSADYNPDHYKIKTITQQIETLKEAMQKQIETEAVSKTFIKNPIRQELLTKLINITTEMSALETKRSSQEQIIEKLSSELQKLPLLEQKFAFLQRETESLLQTLRLLKTKYEEAKIQRDSKESDLKIFELAKTPIVAIPEKKFSSILIGIFIGLLLGIALAFLLEYLDQSFKDPSQVEPNLEIPLLGVVPFIDAQSAVIEDTKKLQKSFIEPFRALRANLKHVASKKGAKMFMISSAVKGEGKTTLAINLAISFAIDGKRVILVDCDLRRPQIHNHLKMPKETGVFDYLIGRKEIKDIIKPSSHDNLSVITSGERHYNTAELLGTPKFEEMTKELYNYGDIIIFDSPAFLPVSDSITMAPKMDGIILVVRSMWTPVKAAKQTVTQFRRIGVNILGTIFNGIAHSHGYYPYYYGYYAYRYAYSYDEEPNKKFSIREFGLNVEKKTKEQLVNIFLSFPHYLSASGNFMLHLVRRKTFWILLLTLLGLSVVQIYLNNQLPVSKQEYITKLEDGKGEEASEKGYGLASGYSKYHGSETKADKQKKMADGDAPSINENEDFNSKKERGNPDQGVEFAHVDTLTEWSREYNERNISRFMRFYDRQNFKYPDGDFKVFEADVRYKWLSASVSDSIINIDTVWSEKINEAYIKTFMILKSVRQADTTSFEWVMIWQKAGHSWRIIREKKRRV